LPSTLKIKALGQEHATLEAKQATGMQFVHDRALDQESARVLLGAMLDLAMRMQRAMHVLTQVRFVRRRVDYSNWHSRLNHFIFSLLAMVRFDANGMIPN
jgi:hypothetical protein